MTIELQPTRHRLAFRAGLKGYANAALDVLPKAGAYPTALHVVFAKDGEGITVVNVLRTKPDSSAWTRNTRNDPVLDDGDTYWLR